MGYKTTSASRTQAKSAVSSSVSVFNNPDGTGFGVSSTGLENKQIKQFSIVPGTSSQTGTSLSGGGTTISSLYITDSNYVNLDDTAVNTSGGYIKLIGENFQSGAKIYFNNTTISNTFVSSSQINAVVPSATVGNYPVYVFNTDGSGAIWAQGLTVSGFPSWTQSSYTSTSLTIDIQLLATGDSALTYTLQEGSSLPSGVSLSSSGALSGTVSDPDVYTFTVIATDSENQGTQQEITLTVSVGESNFKDTILLLSGNGTNNTNNNIFLDTGNNGFSITRNGNAAQGTFTPFSQTGWSNYFDGTDDYLQIADNAALRPGTGDFTVEFWINFSSLTGYQTPFTKGYASAGDLAIQTNTGTGTLLVYISGSVAITASSNSSVGVWDHYALVRSGTDLTLYKNGTSVGSTTNSTNLNSTAVVGIGGAASNATKYSVNGYISNFRYVVGAALYTSSFTPSTTPLTTTSQGASSSQVEILTCQSNRFVDNSTNAFTITPNGNARVLAYSPFAPLSAYSASTVGGSCYLDGNGDSLTIPASSNFAFGTGDFTIEFWAYFTSIDDFDTLYVHDGASGTVQLFFVSGKLRYNNYAVAAILDTTTTIPTNQWLHLAIVRSSGTAKWYLNGVQDGSVSDSTNWSSSSANLTIGRDPTYGRDISGYISSLRVVKGTAVYTTAFTPPTAPVTAITNTSLLLNFANAGIIDSTAKLVLETGGETKISTTQSKFGNSSIYFDGNNDYLSAPYSPLFSLGTGPFTIEGWVYFEVLSGNRMIFDTYTSAVLGGGYQLYWRGTGTSITFYGNGVVIAQSTYTSHVANTWYHIAVTRDTSNNLRIFVDGVQYANAAYSTALDISSTASVSVGIQKATLTNDLAGYVDDFRVTKGYARYTANFTPPALEFKVQ